MVHGGDCCALRNSVPCKKVSNSAMENLQCKPSSSSGEVRSPDLKAKLLNRQDNMGYIYSMGHQLATSALITKFSLRIKPECQEASKAELFFPLRVDAWNKVRSPVKSCQWGRSSFDRSTPFQAPLALPSSIESLDSKE